MNVVDTNYLINELERGKDVKVLCMCPNICWSALEKIRRRYANFHIDMVENNISDIKARKNFILDDYDYIIFYSLDFFNPSEFEEMKELAFEKSNSGKKVSLGYSYMIPMQERKDKDISEEFRIMSFKNGTEYEEKSMAFPFFDIMYLSKIFIRRSRGN